jgi:G:T-mismatch repair DNA endonuclease (very short patch repair protein)/predicted  nucleic acid-binding Zn-ribbon protein
VEYSNNNKKPVIIKCEEHGEFPQTPSNHLIGRGCPKCSHKKRSDKQRLTTEGFIQRAKKIHGDKYNYLKVEYSNNKKPVIIKCREHGEFSQIPTDHLMGSGCPKCCKNQYSKISIDWIEFLSKFHNIDIQHALNGNEFKIPGTRYKADGYCKKTNTIYEFHGDYWHGNPLKYKPNQKTYYGITFEKLYENTKKKEREIQNLGYNLITIWESDWIKINKYIQLIQKKFRKSLQ